MCATNRRARRTGRIREVEAGTLEGPTGYIVRQALVTDASVVLTLCFFDSSYARVASLSLEHDEMNGMTGELWREQKGVRQSERRWQERDSEAGVSLSALTQARTAVLLLISGLSGLVESRWRLRGGGGEDDENARERARVALQLTEALCFD